MSAAEPSEWATERFGAVAADLMRAVPGAIRAAHERALAAHVAGDMNSNDAYGATLKVTQHEELIHAVKNIDGIVCRKPNGLRSRFELVVIEETSTLIFLLRYSTDPKHVRGSVRLRTPVSDLRATLLTLAESTIEPQLTLEQGSRDEDELLAELAEEKELLEQLATLGRVATVGYGSSPTAGIFGLGWGDLELRDAATGHIHWQEWENLVLAEGDAIAGSARSGGPRAVTEPAVRRFDTGPVDDDFGMVARAPLAAPPESEPTPAPEQTGRAPEK